MLMKMDCGCKRRQEELLEAGDGSQVYCVACYSGGEALAVEENDSVQFPTLEEVNQAVDTIPFKRVEENVVYQIVDVTSIETRKGEASVLTLKDRSGIIVKCYASNLVEKSLKHLELQGVGKVHFLTKLGTKTAKESGYSYYNFKIITRKRQ